MDKYVRLGADDIRFRYPKSCYGTKKENGKKCDLPCGKYGAKIAWCPYFHGRGIRNWGVNLHDENHKLIGPFNKKRKNKLRQCDDSPDIWRTCSKVEELSDFESWHIAMEKIKAEYPINGNG